MSAPTPKPVNPYKMALGALAVLLLFAGLITILASRPETDGFIVDEGSPAGRVAGALLLGAGAALGVAWLAVSAVLWKPPLPGERRTFSDPYVPPVSTTDQP